MSHILYNYVHLFFYSMHVVAMCPVSGSRGIMCPTWYLLQHPHGNNAVNVIMCQGSQSSCLEVVRMSAGNVCLFNHRLLLGQTNSSL